jgi:hypothetical protein
MESGPSAKFTNIGDKYVGKILDMAERQQTDINQNLQFFADGSPRMQWVITLELADGEIVGLWVRGGKYKPTEGSGESMLSAIGSAVRAANANSVDVGGQLAIAYTGKSDLGGGKTAKLYTAQYSAPVAQPTSVPVDLFND